MVQNDEIGLFCVKWIQRLNHQRSPLLLEMKKNHKAIRRKMLHAGLVVNRRINFTCWVGGKSTDITADIVDLIIAFIMKIDGGISGSPLTLAIFKNLL